MRFALLALPLIFSAVLCPFGASAQSVDGGAWKKDLRILSNPVKLQTIQGLIGNTSNLKNPAELNKFIQDVQIKKELLIQQTSGGVDSGGGGNLILYKNGALKLLDFVVNPLPASPEFRAPLRISMTPSLKAWGVDRLKLEDFGAEKFLESKINAWEKSSPYMTEVLKKALLNIPIYVLDYEITFHDQKYFFPASARSPEIKGVITAAIYLSNYGLLISKKYFERLDFENQMGLLLHESLRHVQLSYGFGNSDRSLQLLTTALMRGPRGQETLDSAQFLDGDLLLGLVKRAELESLAMKYLPPACRAYEIAYRQSCPVNDLRFGSVIKLVIAINEYLINPRESDEQQLVVRDLIEGYEKFVVVSDEVTLANLLSGASDATNEVRKAVTGANALDVISKDYNENRFWHSYNSEARQIIDGLKKQGVIR